jgi:hypothetical protein
LELHTFVLQPPHYFRRLKKNVTGYRPAIFRHVNTRAAS